MAFDLEQYLNQTLVYWEKTGSDTQGRPIFKTPVEVKCRWENVQEQVLLMDGRIIQSNAHIMAMQMLKHGSILLEGTFATWRAMPTYPRVPTASQGGYEVFKAGHTPDFDGSNLLFEAYT